jgi:hypothetical protein
MDAEKVFVIVLHEHVLQCCSMGELLGASIFAWRETYSSLG